MRFTEQEIYYKVKEDPNYAMSMSFLDARVSFSAETDQNSRNRFTLRFE